MGGLAAEPGSTDPRGASPPYGRPLADRPGPERAALREPGRATKDRPYDAEASTDHRRTQAGPTRLEGRGADGAGGWLASACRLILNVRAGILLVTLVSLGQEQHR